jgi:cytoskeletal protein RodZ
VNSFSDRCYELLGVRPGVSVQELKAAYRDLAKVWHPDRFAHDPRLQQKAQEKLKEINDAYEQLISEKTPGRRVPPTTGKQGRPASKNFHSSAGKVKSKLLTWFVVPAIIFSSVFLFTIRFVQIQRNRDAQLAAEEYQSAEVSDPEAVNEKQISNSTNERASASQDPKSELPPIPTTTVIIDSTTGLLAGEGCPTRIKMTYRTGDEPRAYCSSHLPSPQKESRLKQLSKKTSPEESDPSEKAHPER